MHSTSKTVSYYLNLASLFIIIFIVVSITPSKGVTANELSDPSKQQEGTLWRYIQELVNKLRPFKEVEKRQPFIIGVSGASASGKTTVCSQIISSLKNKRVAVIPEDSFYKPLHGEDLRKAHMGEYNFDHPDALDFDMLIEVLDRLRMGLNATIPDYDFKTHSRTNSSVIIEGADVIVVEGILIFTREDLRNLMDMKIFVETDADTRLVRRIRRDIAERGRDLNSILTQYEKFVKPSYEKYVATTKKFADVIIPRGGENPVAVDLITQHIRSKLVQN